MKMKGIAPKFGKDNKVPSKESVGGNVKKSFKDLFMKGRKK